MLDEVSHAPAFAGGENVRGQLLGVHSPSTSVDQRETNDHANTRTKGVFQEDRQGLFETLRLATWIENQRPLVRRNVVLRRGSGRGRAALAFGVRRSVAQLFFLFGLFRRRGLQIGDVARPLLVEGEFTRLDEAVVRRLVDERGELLDLPSQFHLHHFGDDARRPFDHLRGAGLHTSLGDVIDGHQFDADDQMIFGILVELFAQRSIHLHDDQLIGDVPSTVVHGLRVKDSTLRIGEVDQRAEVNLQLPRGGVHQRRGDVIGIVRSSAVRRARSSVRGMLRSDVGWTQSQIELNTGLVVGGRRTGTARRRWVLLFFRQTLVTFRVQTKCPELFLQVIRRKLFTLNHVSTLVPRRVDGAHRDSLSQDLHLRIEVLDGPFESHVRDVLDRRTQHVRFIGGNRFRGAGRGDVRRRGELRVLLFIASPRAFFIHPFGDVLTCRFTNVRHLPLRTDAVDTRRTSETAASTQFVALTSPSVEGQPMSLPAGHRRIVGDSCVT